MKQVLAFLLATTAAYAQSQPTPLLKKGQPVDWFLTFKFNHTTAPECGGPAPTCIFGGQPQVYKSGFAQQFAVASSADHTLKQGAGCVGDSTLDPIGATFDQIYNGKLSYVIWNDQFKGDPLPDATSAHGHSKGVLAWDASGAGFILQVSTPSWPGSGSAANPRTDGNTLGCVTDNNVLLSQHFFGLKLSKDDVLIVLKGLRNASVATDPNNAKTVHNGGPPEFQTIVAGLGKVSPSTQPTVDRLSSGAWLISKPSKLPVPPWQMVSALLGGEPLRVANFWEGDGKIPDTTTAGKPGCWDDQLNAGGPKLGIPGPVVNAQTGLWNGKSIGLTGSSGGSANHAKIAVSMGAKNLSIFGDMNQAGSLNPPGCTLKQNGRGGLFFVVDDKPLHDSVKQLIGGGAAH